MALASPDILGGDLPPFFKPENHTSDLALIFEPHKVRENVPGKYGPKDCVDVRLTVFRSTASLDKGEPDSVGMVTVTATVLVRDLKELLVKSAAAGDPAPALIAVVGTHPSKTGGNPAWVLRKARDEDQAKAADYYARREAELAARLSEVPPF